VVIGRADHWNSGAGSRYENGSRSLEYPPSLFGSPVSPSALVIPLLGFDEAGFRLGYGAGYYDTTIAAFAEKPYAVGVGFELSRLPTIYPQPHDRPMDVIITEVRVRAWSPTRDLIAPVPRSGNRNPEMATVVRPR